MQDKGPLRVLDANFNRCKEGLRVIEDIFRFILEDDLFRKKIRGFRHSLDILAQEEIIQKAILSRNSASDPGRAVDQLESRRDKVIDLLYINLQRVKESLRVLEEFSKLITPQSTSTIKNIRYEIYTLEKEIVQKWPPLSNTGHRSN